MNNIITKIIHEFFTHEEINREIHNNIQQCIADKDPSAVRATFSFLLKSLFEVAEQPDIQHAAVASAAICNSQYQTVIAMLPSMTFSLPLDAASEELNDAERLLSSRAPLKQIQICVDDTFDQELSTPFHMLCRLAERENLPLQLYCKAPSDEATCPCLELDAESIKAILQEDLTYRDLVRRIDNPFYVQAETNSN